MGGPAWAAFFYSGGTHFGYNSLIYKSNSGEKMTPAPPAESQEEISPKPPWYSLNPRSISRSRIVWGVLIALVLISFSIVPLWRLFWYWPFYSLGNFAKVKDSQGRRVEAWRWIEGREIRVYQMPGITQSEAEEIAAGTKDLLREVGLDFEVTVAPAPEKVRAAYRASLVKKTLQDQPTQCVSFDALATHLIALRGQDPHADMLIVADPIAETPWAHGMSMFSRGLVILEQSNITRQLGKHETGHLMGYMMHDTFPLFVIGYPWEGSPWSRDTLMVLYGTSDQLSPRSREALQYFWRGMEKRTGKSYFVKNRPK